MVEEKKITLCDGKYEFYMQNNSLYCRRYGEEWRHFIGDNAVRALFDLAYSNELIEELADSNGTSHDTNLDLPTF